MNVDLWVQLAGSAAGLVVGYIAGLFTRRALEREPASLRDRRRDLARTALGLLILVLVVATSITSWRVTACQRGYNLAVQRALAERSDAAGQSSQAQIRLLEATQAGDPARSRQAIADYIAALRDLEAARLTFPLPEPDTCGEGR